MNVIGIDFDVKRVTVASLGGPGRWEIFETITKSPQELSEWLNFAYRRRAKTHVALERPFLGRWTDKETGETQDNAQTHFQLSRVYGRIEVLCEQAGLVVVPAPPSEWQAAMLTPQHGKLEGRKQRKALSMMVAEALGADVTNDHQADAVCMSEWLGKRLRLEQEAKA